LKKAVTVVDYGVGNILSIMRALEYLGCSVLLSSRPEEIVRADYVILPGVGSYDSGMSNLISGQLVQPINEYVKKGNLLLGICLGMQMLFDCSEECSTHQGLGYIQGSVVKIMSQSLNIKIPHIGWSRVSINDSLFGKNISMSDSYFYFIHSYHVKTSQAHVLGTTDYSGLPINSIVRNENIIGCQFHPEKSGVIGIKFLENIIHNLK
jgi:imidazole glycerol-phosphate synthase subunit HisH